MLKLESGSSNLSASFYLVGSELNVLLNMMQLGGQIAIRPQNLQRLERIISEPISDVSAKVQDEASRRKPPRMPIRRFIIATFALRCHLLRNPKSLHSQPAREAQAIQAKQRGCLFVPLCITQCCVSHYAVQVRTHQRAKSLSQHLRDSRRRLRPRNLLGCLDFTM